MSDKIKSKLRALERGFELLKAPYYFSTSYFYLAVLFVLFDVEIVLLLPLVSFYTKIFGLKFLFRVLGVILFTLLIE
jgi:NADH:ubiquinone oxidoreductase subunit 3 (subunit A)